VANIDLFQLDGSIAIKGDNALARTITIGQQVTNSDVVVIDTATCALTGAGALTLGAGLSATTGNFTGALTGTSGTWSGNHTFTANTTIAGDNGAARTITLGQQVTFSDLLVIDTANTALTSAGALTLASTGTATTFISTRGGSTNTVYGDNFAAWISGTNNVAIGTDALDGLTTGSDMVAIGLRAGSSVTTTTNGVFIGKDAGQDVDATNVIAIGTEAFQHGTGANNVAIGAGALLGDITTVHTGQFNVAIGADALKSLQGARWNNIAIGGRAMRDSQTGNGNTIVGKDGFLVATDGVNNIMIGNACGNQMPDGDSNIFIGSGAGNHITVAVNNQLRVVFAGGGGGNLSLLCGEMGSANQKAGINAYITDDAGTTPSELYGTLTVHTKSGDTLVNLALDQEADGEGFIDFRGTEAADATKPLSSLTVPGPIQGFAKVEANGTAGEWLPRYGDPASPALTLGVAATTFASTTQYMEITGDAGGNTVATITGGVEGMVLTLYFVDNLVTITDTDATTANSTNLSNGDFNSVAGATLQLVHDGNQWFEVGRSYTGDSDLTLGVAATTFAATGTFMVITGDAGANTVATITGGSKGMLLTLLFVDALVTITDNKGTTADQVDLSAAFTSTADDTIQLVHNGTNWFEVSRSVN
jgi:hypothetical protein